MNRQNLIQKTLFKLGMLGDPQDSADDQIKQRLLKQFWNEKEPANVDKLMRGFIDKENLSKESIQNLLKFFKLKGLFKKTLSYPGIEKIWRIILKDYKLQGFLLEN